MLLGVEHPRPQLFVANVAVLLMLVLVLIDDENLAATADPIHKISYKRD